nr:MAG TPA: hypothetical protein [Caudoviricetes sp.]
MFDFVLNIVFNTPIATKHRKQKDDTSRSPSQD